MVRQNGTGLVVYKNTGGIDAIDQHSRHLVDALVKGGYPALYRAVGLPRAREIDSDLAWTLLQYNPFSYGHWGVAPGLVTAALNFRRRFPGPFVVLVHEGWVDSDDWKSALMGRYQRTQLRALTRVANVVMATTEALAHDIGPSCIHLPVGSNITPVDASWASARERLGISDDEFVVTLFGRDNPIRALEHAEAAIQEISKVLPPSRLRVFNLGADARLFGAGQGIRVTSPGRLRADQLSLHLWASDLVLLPFSDGLSTKRTTLMAALAHEQPVLALQGRATDDVLINSGHAVMLTPPGDRAKFSRAAAEVASDRIGLRTRGRAGRRLYDERFAWPQLAEDLMSAISEHDRVPSGSSQVRHQLNH